VLSLVERADVLLKGYRPGVADRLGVGPDQCLAVNPRLVYARATGWGQTGPLAQRAGHDINYLSITVALHAMGPRNKVPFPPLNLIGDYGGGSMLLLTGVLAALWSAARTGRRQKVDAAMVEGVSLLTQKIWCLMAQDLWVYPRESNFIDGRAPFYRTYRCADGGFMAVGAVEPLFYAQLLRGLGLTHEELPEQRDRDGWATLTDRFAAVFATKRRS
jgi:alpha-methylacyl-CoA racemase